ncbi:ABC transporter permease [Salinarimonas sp.]|uniref:ABC transporter permease n=1 Tax=Salinarimonas sp. TaxID=2766526 RepID=UPI0032D8D428
MLPFRTSPIWIAPTLAARALVHAWPGSLLVALAVAATTFAVALVLTVGVGTANRIDGQLARVGADILVVRQASLEPGAPPTLTAVEVAALATDRRFAASVGSYLRIAAHARAGAHGWFGPILGVDAGYLAVQDVTVARGRSLTARELRDAAPAALLGAGVADRLGLTGAPLPAPFVIGGRPFSVVGILERRGLVGGEALDEAILVGRSAASARLGAPPGAPPDAVSAIIVRAPAGGLPATRAAVEAKLAPDDPRRPLDVADASQVAEAASAVAGAHATFHGVLVLVLAGVGTVAFAAAVGSAALARRGQLAVLRYLGAGSLVVGAVAFVEAAILYVLGAAVGWTMGLIAAPSLAAAMDLPGTLSLEAVTLAVVGSALPSLLAAAAVALYLVREGARGARRRAA